MEILDGKRHDKLAEQAAVERVAFFLNGGGHWGWLDNPDVAKKYGQHAIKKADAVFHTSIRVLVDQWIDSGKDANGIESPSNRDVSKVPAGYDEPLFDVLLAWLGRNMPRIVLLRSGKLAIGLQSPDLHGRDPEEYAKECAIYWLKELLDSSGAHRLARCGNPQCRAYYVRVRERTLEIKRSAHCGNCIGVGSLERVRIGRETRKQRLIQLAADVWTAFKPTRRYARRADWVAAQANKKLIGNVPITGKWVSQNLKAIELEMERRKNAKS